MKNKFKYFILLCVFALLSTGCVKYNATMDVKRDKSMKFSIIYAMDTSLVGDQAVMEDDEIKELKDNGYTVTEYKDDKYKGFKISKKYSNIDKLSDTKDVTYSISDILDNSAKDSKMFKVKKGFFKNTYTAKFAFDMSDSSLSDDSTDMSSMMSSMDLKFTANLPHGATKNNATEKKNGNKNLTWDLTKSDQIEYTFELYNMSFYITIGVVVLLIVAVILVFVKKNSKKEKITFNPEDFNKDTTNNTTSEEKLIVVEEDNNTNQNTEEKVNEPAVEETNVENTTQEENVDNSTDEVSSEEISVDNSVTEDNVQEEVVDNSTDDIPSEEISVDNPVTEDNTQEEIIERKDDEENNKIEQ